jgi:hypothetical protein
VRPKARAAGNALKLFFDRSCSFIESVWAMTAAAFAAITSLEVVFFGENLEAFRRKIVIVTFDQFIFIILLVHKPQSYKLIRNVFNRLKIFSA